jgi:hypothetical protein
LYPFRVLLQNVLRSDVLSLFGIRTHYFNVFFPDSFVVLYKMLLVKLTVLSVFLNLFLSTVTFLFLTDRLAASLTSDIDGPSNNSDPLTRASVRPSSRDPQRKISPSVQALPPIPTRSIVMSPANRRRSLESRKGIEVGSLAGSRRGSEVSRRGSEMSRRGSEVSRRGSEVKYGPGMSWLTMISQNLNSFQGPFKHLFL